MTIRDRSNRAVVVTLAAALTLALGPGLTLAPAQADVAAFTDASDDARARVDIERVGVNNGQRIIVRVGFDNLRKTSGGLSVYFDTRGSDRGPEYLAVGGLGPGTDWQAVRIENWRRGGEQLLLGCDIDLRLRYQLDRATFDVARTCVKQPGRIRVAAMASDSSQRDWAPRRRQFYDWVPR